MLKYIFLIYSCLQLCINALEYSFLFFKDITTIPKCYYTNKDMDISKRNILLLFLKHRQYSKYFSSILNYFLNIF